MHNIFNEIGSFQSQVLVWFYSVWESILGFGQTLEESGFSVAAAEGHGDTELLWFLAIVIFMTKLGSIVSKASIPSVLGQLLFGVVMAYLIYLDIQLVIDISHHEFVLAGAQLGAIGLLLQFGLHSNMNEMKEAGATGFAVALVGVIAPMLFGYFVIVPWFFPNANMGEILFMCAALIATSVGILGSVFKDMNVLDTVNAKISIVAGVIDDVIGLLVLTVIIEIAGGASVTFWSVMFILLKAALFMAVAIFLGERLASWFSKFLASIHTGMGMKLGLIAIFTLVMSYFATLLGLEAIIGAFAAGLLLDQVHFDQFDRPEVAEHIDELHDMVESKAAHEKINQVAHIVSHKHVEDLVEGIVSLLAPIFFLVVGMQVEVQSLFNIDVYVVALVMTVGAILTKMVAGVFVPGTWVDKAFVGISMVPRGEVGLIFLAVGKDLGVMSSEMFSTLLIVIFLTTFVGPIMLGELLKWEKKQNETPAIEPAIEPR